MRTAALILGFCLFAGVFAETSFGKGTIITLGGGPAVVVGSEMSKYDDFDVTSSANHLGLEASFNTFFDSIPLHLTSDLFFGLGVGDVEVKAKDGGTITETMSRSDIDSELLFYLDTMVGYSLYLSPKWVLKFSGGLDLLGHFLKRDDIDLDIQTFSLGFPISASVGTLVSDRVMIDGGLKLMFNPFFLSDSSFEKTSDVSANSNSQLLLSMFIHIGGVL